ncbi:bis(5'-nucleosyl)-tetraphosphatase (symmetrical) YqeK [soil metagenome]
MPNHTFDVFKTMVPCADSLAGRVDGFLRQAGYPQTADHSSAVAAEARRVAGLAGVDPDTAESSGWLHDVSVVIPPADRLIVAESLGLEILPEERRFSLVIHQKLSAAVASDVFQVDDPAVLNAIGCHTTLKAGATQLDKVLFVADKTAWDQPGDPPYLDAMLQALDRSLDAAAFVYLDYLWQRRDSLPVLHPWAAAAYRELSHLSGVSIQPSRQRLS